jgi:hypothetical protein
MMRLSTGRWYEIAGMVLRRVTAAPLEGDTMATWHDRRADLRAEASAIIHVHHTLTAEENGLWNAMRRELDAVNETITRLEREVTDNEATMSDPSMRPFVPEDGLQRHAHLGWMSQKWLAHYRAGSC